MQRTTRIGLKERHSTPLAVPASAESLNATSLQTPLTKRKDSMSNLHSRSGCNLCKESRLSAHIVFVLAANGKPLTPTTPTRAKKLMNDNQAKPVWSKFGQFGIQMLVETGKTTPTTVLGLDFGTKFEGYSIITGKENNLSVMLKLPKKKTLVDKLEERKNLRKARRFRNCRRRECRSDNRSKKGFIAPSQRLIVDSRLRIINEFFKCYPISEVAMEDVCFNHRDNRWGKNFSTVEIGKTTINRHIRDKGVGLVMFQGYDTKDCRDKYGYKKSGNKGAEVFNSHCSDALAIAADVHAQEHIPPGKFIVVDDTYRPVRRQLHDSQPAIGSIRAKYSTGNFKSVRKGTICNHGQICGGTGKSFFIRNRDNRRIGRVHVSWLSHKFKAHNGGHADFLSGSIEPRVSVTT